MIPFRSIHFSFDISEDDGTITTNKKQLTSFFQRYYDCTFTSFTRLFSHQHLHFAGCFSFSHIFVKLLQQHFFWFNLFEQVSFETDYCWQDYFFSEKKCIFNFKVIFLSILLRIQTMSTGKNDQKNKSRIIILWGVAWCLTWNATEL